MLTRKRRSIFIGIFFSTLVAVSLACASDTGPIVNTPTVEDISEGQPVEEAQGQQDVVEEQPTEVPPTETSPPPTPTAALGTSRSNPAPPGSEIFADGMKFLVLGVTRPATDVVMSGNMFNTEPEDGQEYIFVSLSVTCEKDIDSECNFSPFVLKLVGSKGVERDAEVFVSGVDGLLETTDFFGEATITGDIPFIVDTDETDLILVHQPLFLGDEFYLALP